MSNQEVHVKEHAHQALTEGTTEREEHTSQEHAQPVAPLPREQAWPTATAASIPSAHPLPTWPVYAAGPGQQWRPSAPLSSPSVRRRTIWLWIVLISVLLVVFMGGGAFFLAGSLGYHLASTATATRHYIVRASPTIILNEDTGSIHARAGATASDVIVIATRHVNWWSNADDANVTYVQDRASNTITVNVGRAGNVVPFGAASIDFDLIVPGTAVLQFKTNTGSIDVSGVSGPLVLTSNTGSVHASGDTLSGSSTLRTNTGSVTFAGSISTTGTYQFQTNTGSVSVTLPGASVFHVDASTNTGTIHTTFPAVVVVRHQFTGADAHSDVGVAPQATIILITNTGSIELYQK
jgi:hypothetical protein